MTPDLFMKNYHGEKGGRGGREAGKEEAQNLMLV